jgi:hypothetical protein
MPIGFPPTPTIGQQWPTVSPRWEWDGTKWRALSTLGSGATPITERLPSIVGTDDSIWLRGGIPYLASAAAQAGYFGSSPSATAPAALTVGQWSAEPTATPGEIGINIATLPSDGGSAITALEYRVGTGAAIALAGTGTGLRVVTADFTAGVAAAIQVRAVNAVGAADWSDTKTRTPASAPAGGDITYVGAGSPYSTITAATAHTVAVPSGMQVGDLLAVVTGDHAAASSVVTSTGQSLASAVRRVSQIWWVVITGSVPTTVTINLAAASDHSANTVAYRGPTQIAGIVDAESFESRPTIPYTTDSASAAVVTTYTRGHPNNATAAQFNGSDAADYIYKIEFTPVGLLSGIHDGPTGSNNIGMTWSAADTGGHYASVAFKA